MTSARPWASARSTQQRQPGGTVVHRSQALWIAKHEPHVFQPRTVPARGLLHLSHVRQFHDEHRRCRPPMHTNTRRKPESRTGQCDGIPIEKFLGSIARTRSSAITSKAAEETGLLAGTIVAVGGTDIVRRARCRSNEGRRGLLFDGNRSNRIMIPTEQTLDEYRIPAPHVLPGLTMFDAPMAFTGA